MGEPTMGNDAHDSTSMDQVYELTRRDRLETFVESLRRLLEAHGVTITMLEDQEAMVWAKDGDRLQRLGALPLRAADDGASAGQIG